MCHVGKAEDRQKMLDIAVQKYGGLDILVSNAAVNPFFGRALDCPEEMWDKIFDINVKTAFLLFKGRPSSFIDLTHIDMNILPKYQTSPSN